MLIEAIYRRFLPLTSSRGSLELRQTICESTATTQVEPYGVEMARAGRRFLLCNSGAVTGIAPVTAFPTTAAAWLLWNGDLTRTYFFETIGMFNTVGTPGIGGNCIFAIVNAPAQIVTNQTTTTIASASGGDKISNLIVRTGVTITGPAAPNWSSIGDISSTNVGAFPGSGNVVNRDIAGRIAIQPGQGLALSFLTPAGAFSPLWAPFVEWVELEIDME